MADRSDYLVGDGSEFFMPDCNRCVHFEGKNICKAFPEGIPGDILEGEKHNKIWPGQTGAYVFEKEQNK